MARDYTPKIPKVDLIHGEYYIGRCRNAKTARWDATRECFIYWREKFGHRFLEEIKCPEDDQTFDVFVTERVANPDEIKYEINLGDLK